MFEFIENDNTTLQERRKYLHSRATGPELAVVIENGTLIDGTGKDPVRKAGVVTRGKKIEQAGPMASLKLPKDGATRIDATGKTIMPGMVDGHCHVGYTDYNARTVMLYLDLLGDSIELNCLKAARNAEMILATGFTTLGDGGSRGAIGVAVRDAIEKGIFVGPRIFAAGRIIHRTSGLVDILPHWVNGVNDGGLGVLADGPEEVRKVVRLQLKAGVDWIKVGTTGVLGSPFSNPYLSDLTFDEIKMAVDEMAAVGKCVHGHAHGLRGIKNAIKAGIRSFHSGVEWDEEVVDMLKNSDTVYMPSIAYLHRRATYQDVPEWFLHESQMIYEDTCEGIRASHAAGCKIAIGTDATPPWLYHDERAQELEYLVNLGMSNMETIVAATSMAAYGCDMHEKVGTLGAGKLADVLVVDGDPLTDITVLQKTEKLSVIMKDGKVYKNNLG